MTLAVLYTLVSFLGIFSCVTCKNISSRPISVSIGAIFTFNSTIGKAAKVAIEAAVADVNSDPNVLRGSRLVVHMQDSDCNPFIGTLGALQFMGTDIVAIIGPQSSVIAHVMSVMSNELQVPLVSFAATDPTLSSVQYPFFVRMTQSDLFQMEAVAEIVDYYQWRQVIAIYIDDDYGRNGISFLGDKLNEKRCLLSYKAALPPGANRTDVSDLLVKVAVMGPRVIVVHVNPDLGTTIFSVAHSLDMMVNGYVWIATDWLLSLLDSSSPLDIETMNTMQGVIALRQHTPGSKLKDGLVSKWSELTKKGNDGNLQLNAYGLYAYDTVWVIAHAMDAFLNDGGHISFSSDPRLHTAEATILHLDTMTIFDEGRIFLNKIRNTNLTGVTGLVQFDSDGNLIHPAYDIINVIGTGVRTVGYWSNYTGLSIVTPEKLYTVPANRSRANQNLYSIIWPGPTTTKPRGWVFPNNGKDLRIGVPNRVSFRDFVSQAPASGIMKGFCVDVFTAAVNLLPYAVTFRLVPFGNGHENPNFTELVNKVAANEFDAAIGDIAITTERTKLVDFTQPYIESGLVLLAPTKNHNSNAWAFLQPFTVEMWCVTGISFLAVGSVIWILEHRINDEFRGPPGKQLVTIFWFSFSTLFFSHRESTMSTLGRVVLIIWLFVVTIIQSSYTASLTSILTVQQLSSPIKGFDSLINSNEPIGFQTGSFAEHYMVEELGISRSRLKRLGSPEEYARALKLGPNNGGVSAIVDERPYVDLFLSTECNFAVIGSEFTRSGWGFVFPRESPFAVDMSTAILTLSEGGDLQRIHNEWLARSACGSLSEVIESDRLLLSSFWGLFLICGIACFVSLLVFFILILWQFIHHTPPMTPESYRAGSSRSNRSLQTFLSFVDDKEEDARAKRRRLQMAVSDNGICIES